VYKRQVVATAIHDGHLLRDECASGTGLDDATRLREEDPFTARIAALVPTRLIATRSRFEVDLNRPRDKAVYTCPEDAWGLACWRESPTRDLIERSLAVYDEFYATLERVLRDRWRSTAGSSCSTSTPTTTAATVPGAPRRSPRTPRSTSAPRASTARGGAG
jgi:N-formylglutamate amidohydrolase